MTNSNSWNNVGTNYGGALTASQVFHSNGGFAGQNNNLDTDPMLDPGGVPLAASPLVDAGDATFDQTITDTIGTPRTSGNQTDIGAFEFVPTYVTQTQPKSGEAFTIQLENTAPAGVVVHAIGTQLTPFQIAGLGTLLVNPGNLLLTPALATPGAVTFQLPALASSFQLVTQSFVAPNGATPFFTNAIVNTVQSQ